MSINTTFLFSIILLTTLVACTRDTPIGVVGTLPTNAGTCKLVLLNGRQEPVGIPKMIDSDFDVGFSTGWLDERYFVTIDCAGFVRYKSDVFYPDESGGKKPNINLGKIFLQKI